MSDYSTNPLSKPSREREATPIETELNRIREDLKGLQSIAEQLGVRIAPVLNPSGAVGILKAMEKDVPASSDIRLALMEIGNMIIDTRQTLADFLDRVEC